MTVPSRELGPEDLELIEFARQIVDANTDGEDGSTRWEPRSDIRVILPTPTVSAASGSPT